MTRCTDVRIDYETVCSARTVAARWRGATTIQKYFRGRVTRRGLCAAGLPPGARRKNQQPKPTEPPVGGRVKDDSEVIKMLREHIDILGRLHAQDEKDWIFQQKMDQVEIDSKACTIKYLREQIDELQEDLKNARQLAYDAAKEALILRRMIK